MSRLISWIPKAFEFFNKNGYLKTETFEIRHREQLDASKRVEDMLSHHTAQDNEAIHGVYLRIEDLRKEMFSMQDKQTDRLIKVIMENRN